MSSSPGGGALDREIRSLRPPKSPVDPQRPIASLLEDERAPDGTRSPWVVAFLAGAECPFTCVFCDLWRNTLDGPTPAGAIPRQIELARDAHSPLPAGCGIKLYNASNFFDERAVPGEDWPAIVGAVRPFHTVTVECHPRLIGPSCRRFAEALDGRLEVAMGLETIHRESLAGLNKRMTLADFDGAADAVLAAGATLRVFVLIGGPHQRPEEVVEWCRRSAEHARACGAGVISLIPLRPGNGALDRLVEAGQAPVVTLRQVEEAFAAALEIPDAVVLLDLWDLERLATCPDCSEGRLARLRRMDATGRIEPAVDCPRCG